MRFGKLVLSNLVLAFGLATLLSGCGGGDGGLWRKWEANGDPLGMASGGMSGGGGYDGGGGGGYTEMNLKDGSSTISYRGPEGNVTWKVDARKSGSGDGEGGKQGRLDLTVRSTSDGGGNNDGFDDGYGGGGQQYLSFEYEINGDRLSLTDVSGGMGGGGMGGFNDYGGGMGGRIEFYRAGSSDD